MSRDPRLFELKNQNIVDSYVRVQDRCDAARLTLRRDINSRKLLLHNTGSKKVDVAITVEKCGGVPPKPLFSLETGDQVLLAVNPSGGRMQYIWLLNDKGQIINTVHPIKPGVNDMVIREGTQNWFIHDFIQPPERAS